MLFKEYAEKHHEILKKYFPSYMIWPKKIESYVLTYQITVVVFLLLIVAGIIYVLIN